MISEKEFSAEEQKIIYFNKKAYENGELMYCKNMYDIADQLQNDETVFSYGGEEYVVKVEGDKIIITACIIDSMAYASDRHWDEYVIDFSDCKMDAFGSVYIDSTAFIEKMTEFSAYRYENGWISAETIGCWEEKVDAIIEQQAEVMGIDYNSLDDATKEEIREQSIICADLEDKLINVYLSNRKTASDEFNEFWDEMMLGAGVACALMFLVTPAGVAELATFTIGIADGTKKIWQGDTVEGVTEIGISVIGEIAYVAKEVSEGRKVAKLMDGATGAVDDLDFAIDASKFDDLEYIKANPLSENYYLSEEEIRYRQFWRRVEEGRNVMPEDEYAKWMYSDSKVVDYLTIEEVDYDDILSLRKSEQMSQTIDDAASVQKIIASEGGNPSNIREQMMNSSSADLWGVLDDGTNQGVKHFADYWEKYPERIPSLAKRLGVDVSQFENSVEGFENFTEQALKVKNNGILREVNGKQIYYVEGAANPNKGVVVILNDGKLQSMMPSRLKDFNKLQ